MNDTSLTPDEGPPPTEPTSEQAKLEALRAAILEGEQSGLAPDGVFERVFAELHDLDKL